MKKIALVLFIIFGVFNCGYCAGPDIQDLVDNFQKATDLQRDVISKDNIGKQVTAGGTVTNAGEYDFFDTVSDVKGTYYEIQTLQQKTKNGVPYQVVFLFRDKEAAANVNRDQLIQKDGRIIKLEDERLQVAVWIFCGEMTDKDAALFKKAR